MRFRASALAPLCLVALATTSPALAQVFRATGFLPGGHQSVARGISADGSTVVGYADGKATRWTSAGGLQNLGTMPGYGTSFGIGASADGSKVLIMSSQGAVEQIGGHVWSNGTATAMGPTPYGTYAQPYAMSANGGLVVGTAQGTGSFDRKGFYWTPEGGYTMMPSITFDAGDEELTTTAVTAEAVSPDGSTIAGRFFLGMHAYRWRAATGFQILTNFGLDSSAVYAMSTNGDIAVGSVPRPGTNRPRAAYWDAIGQLRTIPALPTETTSLAQAVNGDGSIMGGYSITGDGRHAFLWSQATGTLDLNSYLPTLGVNLTGWTLTEVTGVSADGFTISGKGTRTNVPGFPIVDAAWTATIPSPASASVLLVAGVVGIRRRR